MSKKPPPTPLGKVVDFFGSFGLACILLLLLFLLTFLGTIEQVNTSLYEVQKKYFESMFLVHELTLPFGTIPIPLPGVALLLSLLAVNLAIGGMVRIRKNKKTVGVIVIHCGIALLMLAGVVKLQWSDEGALAVYEGMSSDEFQSYHEWEIAIWDAAQTAEVKEWLIDEEAFLGLRGEKKATIKNSELPFTLELSHYVKNCKPMPKGPMWEGATPTVDSFALQALEPDLEHERNMSGMYLTWAETSGSAKGEGILWGAEAGPLLVTAGGKRWAIDLRKKRFSMPFTIHLEDFTREFYPGTQKPKVFSSDVIKIEQGTRQPSTISMNEPLRDSGYVLFQSSYGPENPGPGQKFYSVFAVVRNPSDYWPLYACIVIAVGLLMVFGQRLYAYVQGQAKKRVAV